MRDSAGYVHILDRIKDVVNRGGYKIYSAEVENVFAEFADVLEAAVVGRPCPVLGERVHAFIVLRPGARLCEDDLRRHAAARLADYKQPETYVLSEAPLPRSSSGKILKRNLRAVAAAADAPRLRRTNPLPKQKAV
jgi:O-succinylbenzoic acid--CoA ligase